MKAAALTAVVCANALMVFHIILTVQIENHKHWLWPLVFIPMWVGIIFLMIFMLWFVSFKISQRSADAWWILLGIFTILLPIKLNNPNSAPSWYGVFVPYWLGLAIFLLVDESWPRYNHHYSTESFEHTGVYERYFQVFPKMGLTAFAIYGVLHTIHLEQHYYFSWPVIFSPFLIFTGLFFFTALSNRLYVNNSDSFENGLWPFLAALPFIAFEILLLMYLMGHIHSFAIANIPLYLVDLIAWFLVCVLFCTL